MGVTTISHTKLLIYHPFPAKVNKLKTNKEYIVSKRLTALVSIF
nr:MAG TPA: Inner kinetochore subunit IML3, Inner kinetochore, DNA, nucleosome, DNA.15A [Bacteriophage sp.]